MTPSASGCVLVGRITDRLQQKIILGSYFLFLVVVFLLVLGVAVSPVKPGIDESALPLILTALGVMLVLGLSVYGALANLRDEDASELVSRLEQALAPASVTVLTQPGRIETVAKRAAAILRLDRLVRPR